MRPLLRRIMERVLLGPLLAASCVSTGCSAAAPSASGAAPACSAGADGVPTTLACTGLYSDAASETLSEDILVYEPGSSLWADGADKRRFLRLPAGTTIDTSDMDHWIFPVGAKLWKEFSIAGRKLETRYEEKRPDGSWARTTYMWSEDQSTAQEITSGAANVGGTGYDIPAQAECARCHSGAKDGVLGFEAIGLSEPAATGLTMSELVARKLVTAPPQAPLAIPGTPTEVAALAWLHANCGLSCHNSLPRAMASFTGLLMRLNAGQLVDVKSTDTYTTAVGVPSNFQPSAGAGFDRIKPGDVAHSAVPFRALARDSAASTGVQMPPLGTRVPDMAGVALVDAWIDAM